MNADIMEGQVKKFRFGVMMFKLCILVVRLHGSWIIIWMGDISFVLYNDY